MRAVLCRKWGMPDQLEVAEIARPAVGAGDVLIAVKAAGVNYPDALMVQGKYQLKPPFPFTPGAEIAGEVLAVGDNVDHLKTGDRVVAFCGVGGFAEEAVVAAALVMPIPTDMTFPLAAAFTLAYGTSWHALADRGALKAGETLLVLGAAGGVGLAAVEIGKALGATVIAAASSAEKLAICREHGADHVIDYEHEDLRESLKKLALSPDVVFDPVGGRFAEPAFRSIAWRGRYLVIGFAAGDIPALPWNLALLKGASLVGVFWGEFVRREGTANLAGIRQLLGWLREGRIRPLISRTYTLEQVPQALDDLLARRATGKLVVAP
ncbi:MAG: NADPH:quinone oxidoreductase family protein [Betaproteobacteria bacterium]|nr:NADPH:quinone oxidoreductase family protein [Betaproteobacteria bacterium]